MGVFTRIKNLLLYPVAYFYFALQSYKNSIKSLFKRNNVVFEKEYLNEKILLLALYEKGVLRDDIRNLLEVAKSKGAYVICVNTLKLKNPEQYTDLMDCYIERYNYGRDFGSYKTGFMYLYERQLHEKCPRLLVLNDSLFYSKKNQPKFIDDLLTTEIEVLGATENHEIEHHIGSFCLSLDGDIVRNNLIKRYWKKYKNSDVRPVVIKRGEMGLSKVLRRCVTSPDNFTSLFDIAWFSEYLKNNPETLNTIYDLIRSSDLVDWKVPSLQDSTKKIMHKFCIHNTELDGKNIDISADIKESGFVFFADTLFLAAKAIQKSLKCDDFSALNQRVLEEARYDLIDCFSSGSQIHQNGILLHKLGMPIIKLDALFRGMYSAEDIEKLSLQLESIEAQKFKKLLFSKPFGGKVLFGWKRAAFYRGLI